MNQRPDSDRDRVLIVGAGPTGLTLAVALTRYGVPVRIIEKKPALSQHSKATNLMQRNQELIAALGLLAPLAAVSGHMRRLMVQAYGADLGPRTMRLAESPYTDVLLCGQDRFERVMADGLAELGVDIEFGTELVALEQDAAGVRVQLDTGGGGESARFGWAAGCDGATGISRTFTALDFTPERTGVAIRQIDCRLQWRRLPGPEQMWLFYFNRGFAVVVPLPGGVHRILTIEPKDAFPERTPTLAEMQEKLRAVAGDDQVLLSDERWSSYTDLAMGLAPGLRDGRVFLVGDVGNPILPNGGQGMNTGIADAYDLAWKLAAVIGHQGPDTLLDSYSQERHALRRNLQKAQYASLKYTTLTTPRLSRAAFRRLAEPLLNHGGEYRVAQAFSELTLHTRDSPVTLDAVGRRGLRAGDRALDALTSFGGASMQLYDLLYTGAWTLLAFSGRGRTADPGAAAAAITGLARPDLRSFLINTSSTADSGTPVLDGLDDLDGEIHRIYGIRRPCLVLVRPDGHIGARVSAVDADRLARYLRSWLPDAHQEFLPEVAPVPVAP